MTEEEFRKNMYNGNRYKCGFCGEEVINRPTLTLCLCKGLVGDDISDICEECLEKIKRKVILQK